MGFFQFLRNFHQLTAFEQAEMILYAALDPAIASKARKGDFVRCLDHFNLLQSRDKLSGASFIYGATLAVDGGRTAV